MNFVSMLIAVVCTVAGLDMVMVNADLSSVMASPSLGVTGEYIMLKPFLPLHQC